VTVELTLKLTTDRHETPRCMSATAALLVAWSICVA